MILCWHSIVQHISTDTHTKQKYYHKVCCYSDVELKGEKPFVGTLVFHQSHYLPSCSLTNANEAKQLLLTLV